MKKIICAGLCVLLCAGLLAGCGDSSEAVTSTVYVDKKGAVTSVDVEVLDQSYYDESELKEYITGEVEAYNEENGKNAVRLEDLSVEEGTACLRLKYKKAEDYSRFNGIEFYQGKVVTSLAAGYTFDTEFARIEDGDVTGSATKQDIYEEEDLKVVVIRANTDVKVEGNICYVSTENVRLTGPDTVSIREGAGLSGLAQTPGTNSIPATEQAATEEPERTLVTGGAFETDVYTYIIYK